MNSLKKKSYIWNPKLDIFFVAAKETMKSGFIPKILSFAGSVPFYLSGMSTIDSIFESMSGITTTGATVISDIDSLPESLLFYRQLLQWMGGMGLIVLAIAVMPLLGIGGGQIYKTEIPGAMGEQKLTPRIKEFMDLNPGIAVSYTHLTLPTSDLV